MKKILFFVSLLGVHGFVGAGETVSTSGSVAGSVAYIEAADVPAETTSRLDYSGSYKLKNVPAVGAPALTSSNDTCMGSTSGGVGVAGLGITLGTTWSDENCLMLKNSRELWNMGMRAAAMARMCMDEKNKEALELTGFVCPQPKKEEVSQSVKSGDAQPAPTGGWFE